MIRSLLNRVIFGIMVSLVFFTGNAQHMDLSMGNVTLADLSMKNYPNDTSANAVVLNELGQAYMGNGDQEGLIFDHYMKIKILNKKGFDQANFEIRLYKNDKTTESLLSVEGHTYNLVNGRKTDVKMDAHSVFKQDDHKYSSAVKFTLPDVREGSVVEVKYTINSPFTFNFRSWEFQSDLPKVHSEYWALIPANYVYNISLKGFYKLTKNESSIVNDCYEPGGGNKANCALMKYAIDNVPAFVEEDYMTARSNFISAIHFELSELKYFDGRIDKKTKEWRDVDQELRDHDDFGVQVRKARNVWEDKAKALTSGAPDDLKKAALIYDFIKENFTWNDFYGMFTDVGTKKAFETKKGNAADINLSLVGALQSIGLNATPVILSTRENGLPVELFPVISQFNYVIGAVDIGDKRYLLDATNALQPFGFLPLRCLNGKGRLMTKESSWIELKPKDKKKTVTSLAMTLTKEGVFEGTVTINYLGYDAFTKRSEIWAAGDTASYRKIIQKRSQEVEVVNYKLENVTDLEKPLIEKMEIKLVSNMTASTTVIYFNPFLFGRIEDNPFKSSERWYPVDFGSPREDILSVNLQNNSGYQLDELPATVGLTLPQGGGRFLFNVGAFGNRITITSSMTINKAVYNSGEYHYLKELFARIVQINQSQIVLKKKT